MAVRLPTGHTHLLLTRTSINREHRHRIATTSTPPILLRNGNHVHRVRSYTTFDRRHTHRMSRLTGPGISLGNGRHVHLVRALTTVDREHRHAVRAETSQAPNIPASVVRRALRRN
ncbi:MAG: YmaF family protein [Bacillota bacterium]|jgi:hypothetical protein